MNLPYLITIDPSLSCTGFSLFYKNSLVESNLVVNTNKKLSYEEKIHRIFFSVKEYLSNILKIKIQSDFIENKEKILIITEWPQIYKYSKASPNSLLEVSASSSVCIAAINANYNKPIKTIKILPREWKGQVPKKEHNNRILEKLTNKEKNIVEENIETLKTIKVNKNLIDNVIDSIGIGLWACGRLKGPKLIEELI